MIESRAQDETNLCTWREVNEGEYWQTSCGKSFILNNGTPKENGMNYCCYCGDALIQGPFLNKEMYESLGFGPSYVDRHS